MWVSDALHDVIVDGAIAQAKTPAKRRIYWIGELRAGGVRAGAAVSKLFELTPATPDIVAAWDASVGSPAAEPSPEQTYADLYPDDEAAYAERRGREPDRLAQTDMRHAWLTSRAAAGSEADGGEPAPGHGPLGAVVEHSHVHPDYQGGEHTHVHSHAGDANHGPSGNHMHQLASQDQVAAGIERREADQVAAAERVRRIETMSDDEVIEFMGPPPGWR